MSEDEDKSVFVIAYGMMVLYGFAMGLFAGWIIWT